MKMKTEGGRVNVRAGLKGKAPFDGFSTTGVLLGGNDERFR